MTTTASRPGHKSKSIAGVAIGALAITSLTLFLIPRLKESNQQLPYSDEQIKIINQDVDRIVQEFEIQTQFSKQITVGSKMEPVKFQPFDGHPQPNWHKLSLVTFGSEFSPAVHFMHDELKQSGIQYIHIVYPGQWSTEPDPLNLDALRKFKNDVALLDGVSQNQDTKSTLKQLGVHSGGYAFLRDEQGTVLYAANDIGLDAPRAVQDIKKVISSGKLAEQSPIRFKGLNLPMNGFDATGRQLAQQELSRDYALAFITSGRCESCDKFLIDSTRPLLQSTHASGFGVVKIDLDSPKNAVSTVNGYPEISIQKSEDGNQSELYREWNIRSYPSVFIFKKGTYQGSLLYRSWEFNDGKKAEHIQILAASSVLKKLSSTHQP